MWSRVRNLAPAVTPLARDRELVVGDEFDVMQLYDTNIRRLWPVVATIGGHHLR
jgi:hypothetical protein